MSAGNMALRLLRAALSRSALFWLFAAWVLWYVTWAVWAEEAFATFITSLKASLAVRGIFAFGIANAAYNLARGFRERMKLSLAGAVLRAVLPLGGVLFSAGFLMSAVMRDEGRLLVGAGEQLSPAWEREHFTVSRIDLALKDEVSDIEYSSEPGLFFVNEPRMSVDAGPDGSVVIGAYPPVKLGSTYYHILNYGIGPGIRFYDAGGALIEDTFVMTGLLPPGSTDTFEAGGGAYSMSIALEPVRVIEKGEAKARVYDLKHPLYRLTVKRAEESVFEGTLRDKASFNDGSMLDLLPPEPWVWVEASTGEGFWLLTVGIALITLGIPLSFGLAVGRLARANRQEQGE